MLLTGDDRSKHVRRLIPWVPFALMVCLAGCASSQDERLRVLNDDGIYLYQHGQFQGAKQTFDEALKLAPEDPHLHYNLGQCYAKLDQLEKAEASYQTCLNRSPNHAECRFALASLWDDKGKVSESKQMIDQWMQEQPRLADPYALDGWYWHQMGDLPRAQSRLQQALTLNPQCTFALTELGLVYEDLHRPERSLVLYERALKQSAWDATLISRIRKLQKNGVGKPLLDEEPREE